MGLAGQAAINCGGSGSDSGLGSGAGSNSNGSGSGRGFDKLCAHNTPVSAATLTALG